MNTIYDVPILLRREIEALMIKPFLAAFGRELGQDKVDEIVREVVTDIAKKQGAQYAEELGGNGLEQMMAQEQAWRANDALEMESVISEDGRSMSQTIKRCAYVDMYERIGMKELGYQLSCFRDYPFYEGFNEQMKMTRSKTLMQGHDCCDFCFQWPQE